MKGGPILGDYYWWHNIIDKRPLIKYICIIKLLIPISVKCKPPGKSPYTGLPPYMGHLLVAATFLAVRYNL